MKCVNALSFSYLPGYYFEHFFSMSFRICNWKILQVCSAWLGEVKVVVDFYETLTVSSAETLSCLLRAHFLDVKPKVKRFSAGLEM